MLETWQTPHFNQKDHVSISVSYIPYLSDNRKCSKMSKQGQKGPKGGQRTQNLYLANYWSQKLGRPFISIRKIMFLLVFHIFRTYQITGSAQKCPNRVKRDQKGVKRTQNLYLANHWSQKRSRPLISIRKIMFLLVFHMFYTSQITGSAQNCPNMVTNGPKEGQKDPECISHEPLVKETWQTPHFNQKDHVSISVSYISYLSDNRKCSKMPKQGQKV